MYVVHRVLSLCFMRSEVGHRSLTESVAQVQTLKNLPNVNKRYGCPVT